MSRKKTEMKTKSRSEVTNGPKTYRKKKNEMNVWVKEKHRKQEQIETNTKRWAGMDKVGKIMKYKCKISFEDECDCNVYIWLFIVATKLI
jgi:DUF971 family protein